MFAKPELRSKIFAGQGTSIKLDSFTMNQCRDTSDLHIVPSVCPPGIVHETTIFGHPSWSLEPLERGPARFQASTTEHITERDSMYWSSQPEALLYHHFMRSWMFIQLLKHLEDPKLPPRKQKEQGVWVSTSPSLKLKRSTFLLATPGRPQSGQSESPRYPAASPSRSPWPAMGSRAPPRASEPHTTRDASAAPRRGIHAALLRPKNTGPTWRTPEQPGALSHSV